MNRRAAITNDEIAHALEEMSLFLEMKGVQWRPRAYEKAAQSVAAFGEPLAQLYAQGGVRALDAIPNVGEGIAKRIGELLTTGRSKELEALRKAMPVDVRGLTAVEGIGPKHVKQLYEQLGVRTIAELEQAASAERIRELPGFGEKTERKILAGVHFVNEARGRLPLGQVLGIARDICARLQQLPFVLQAEVAGSIRRRKETIGDMDFLVASGKPREVAKAFASLPEVAEVRARGPTKTVVRLAAGLDADLRVVPEESWGAALCYFTGSKAHNIVLRRMAQQRGYKLNEYGLHRGKKRIAGASEEEIYRALELPYIAPELREDRGEIAAAQSGALPELVGYDALRGDLQLHSTWTDGRSSMEEMVGAAKALGLQYVAITDHTRDLPMAKGNDEERLLAQLAAIRALDARTKGIRVLAGAEVNIRRDGSLDIADAALAKLDLVTAGVHSDFKLSRREMTARVLRAIEHPQVDILVHPTARLIGRRPPCELDMEAVLQAALRTGTALEIDAQPSRLDLKDDHVRRAVELGVRLVISSDAHDVHELRFASELGVAVARRGWATADDILNTKPISELLAHFKR